MDTVHVKRRDPAPPGSIPNRLQMFVREVRFYREVAAQIGVRVPCCFVAEVREDGGTRLELEDLSGWQPGADPEAAAEALRRLHDAWEGTAVQRWSWLPRPDVADLVENLFGSLWPSLRERHDLTTRARDFGDRLVGRVREAERFAEGAGPETLVHWDASAANMRTSPSGVVALLDWEDVGSGAGVADLAWHLVSSVDPEQWDAAIAAYGSSTGLDRAFPAACVQALLSLSAEDEGTPAARQWIAAVSVASQRT